MSAECFRNQEEAELFTLGLLEGSRQVQLDRHLQQGCVDCRNALMTAQAVTASVADTAPVVHPRPEVAQQLLRRVQQEPRVAVRTRRAVFPWLLAAASLAGMAWLGSDRLQLRRQLQDREHQIADLRQRLTPRPSPAANQPSPTPQSAPPQRLPDAGAPVIVERFVKDEQAEAQLAEWRRTADELRRQMAERDESVLKLQSALNEAERRVRESESRPPSELVPAAELAATRAQVSSLQQSLDEARAALQRQTQQLAEYRRAIRILGAPGVRPVQLRGVDPAAGRAHAFAVFAPDAGLLLMAKELPPLAGNKCYQLWAIRKGNPAILSAGLLRWESGGDGVLFAPPSMALTELSGLAITDEPQGGSPSARGHKLLFGSL